MRHPTLLPVMLSGGHCPTFLLLAIVLLDSRWRSRTADKFMGEHRVFIPVDFVSEYGSAVSGGTTHTYFAVALADSLPTDLPLTPNLRRPNKKTEVFHQILNSLRTAPERFLDRNNGIKLAVRSIEIEKTRKGAGIWLDFGEDKATGGVLNGGHTLAAIQSARIEGVPLGKARVKIEILCGLDDREVSTTSVSVNTATAVDTRSKLNALGVFDPVKEYLDRLSEQEQHPLRIAYYQNQEGVGKYPHCSIMHVYDLLLHLDRLRYDFNKPGKNSHPKGIISTSTLKSQPVRERIVELLPLIFDVLWIENNLFEMVHKYLENLKGVSNLIGVKPKGIISLMDGSYFGFTTSVMFSLPVVAAYRVFISESVPCNSWIVPFEHFAPVLLPELWNWYREQLKKEKARGNESFTSFIRNPSIWSDLCLVAQEVQRNFLKEYQEKAKFLPTHTLINSDSGETTLVCLTPTRDRSWSAVYTAENWFKGESSMEYHVKLGLISQGRQLANYSLEPIA